MGHLCTNLLDILEIDIYHHIDFLRDHSLLLMAPLEYFMAPQDKGIYQWIHMPPHPYPHMITTWTVMVHHTMVMSGIDHCSPQLLSLIFTEAIEVDINHLHITAGDIEITRINTIITALTQQILVQITSNIRRR